MKKIFVLLFLVAIVATSRAQLITGSLGYKFLSSEKSGVVNIRFGGDIFLYPEYKLIIFLEPSVGKDMVVFSSGAEASIRLFSYNEISFYSGCGLLVSTASIKENSYGGGGTEIKFGLEKRQKTWTKKSHRPEPFPFFEVGVGYDFLKKRNFNERIKTQTIFLKIGVRI